MHEVHPVARPIVDTQFRDTSTDWLDVAEETRLQTHDALSHPAGRTGVGKSFQPAGEDNSLADFEHSVICRLQRPKCQLQITTVFLPLRVLIAEMSRANLVPAENYVRQYS